MARYKNATGSQKGVVALVDENPVAVIIAAGATTEDIDLVSDHPANRFHLDKGNVVEVEKAAPVVSKPKKSEKAE